MTPALSTTSLRSLRRLELAADAVFDPNSAFIFNNYFMNKALISTVRLGR